MNREGVDREGMNREQQLRRDIEELTVVTAALEAAAGDLLNDQSVAPSNAKAREEVIEMLGVNYVGPEIFNKIFEPKSPTGWFKKVINHLNPFKDRVIPFRFEEPPLDFVKLKEILNEPDEWDSIKKKFQTYALVYKPRLSFLELMAKANEAASAQGKDPAFLGLEWYNNEAFATEVSTSGSWELVRRETVPGSTDKVFDKQTAMIADKPELLPTTFPALAALLVGQYLEHGVKLYEGEIHYGRTSTCAASGGPVSLGIMDASGARVHVRVFALDYVGLSVSRNLESFSEVFAGMKRGQSF